MGSCFVKLGQSMLLEAMKLVFWHLELMSLLWERGIKRSMRQPTKLGVCLSLCIEPETLQGIQVQQLSSLHPGQRRDPYYTDKYLMNNGAALGSTIVMTENGFMTEQAWEAITPFQCKGIRDVPFHCQTEFHVPLGLGFVPLGLGLVALYVRVRVSYLQNNPRFLY